MQNVAHGVLLISATIAKGKITVNRRYEVPESRAWAFC